MSNSAITLILIGVMWENNLHFAALTSDTAPRRRLPSNITASRGCKQNDGLAGEIVSM